MAVIRNVYAFIEHHIDRSLPKEHLGYIVDRVGYPAFRAAVLADVPLAPPARVAETLNFRWVSVRTGDGILALSIAEMLMLFPRAIRTPQTVLHRWTRARIACKMAKEFGAGSEQSATTS